MMRRVLVLICLLAGLGALPAPAEAQPASQEGSRRRGPVELLLRERSRLGLSDEQVTRLETIQAAMEERNRPLVERLLEIRREMRAGPRVPREQMTPEQREAHRRWMERARPLLREIHQSKHAAMREVGEVLTEEQKATLRTLLRERHPRGEHDHRKRGSRRGSHH